jgi:hypothetical protein
MSFTLGRASFTNDLTAITHNGDRLSIRFDILPTTLAEAKVLRQQVLGLADNPDEPVVPLTWSADSDYDGFYRVLGARVDPVLAYQTNRLMRCAVDLERVGGGYKQAEIDGVAVVSVRSFTNSTPDVLDRKYTVAGFPSSADWREFEGDLDLSISRTGEFGTSASWYDDTTPNTDKVILARAYIDAADYYDAACRVEQDVSSTWYEVVGDQATTTTPAELRISNGLARISHDGSDWLLEAWESGPGWETVGTFDLNTSGGVLTPYSPTIVRNSPEAVTLHYLIDGNVDVDNGRLTLTLRRGSLSVEATLERIAASPNALSIDHSTTSAATTTTGGLFEATGGGTAGHRWVLATEAAYSTDTTNGALDFTSGLTTSNWCVGVNLSCDVAGNNDPASVVGQWWLAHSERFQVSAR